MNWEKLQSRHTQRKGYLRVPAQPACDMVQGVANTGLCLMHNFLDFWLRSVAERRGAQLLLQPCFRASPLYGLGTWQFGSASQDCALLACTLGTYRRSCTWCSGTLSHGRRPCMFARSLYMLGNRSGRRGIDMTGCILHRQ